MHKKKNSAGVESETPKTEQNIQFIQDGLPHSYYSNSVKVIATLWDIRMLFGEIQDIDEESKKMTVNHRSTITMAWPHVKAFFNLLGERIGDYEKKFGPIPPRLPNK